MNSHDSRCRAISGCLLIALAIWSGAALVPPTAVAGVQEVILSQPSKDSGSKISSEIYETYGLVSVVANDFSYPSNATITKLSWWGGPYRTPAEATEFNVYFYADNSCKPGTIIDSYLNVTPAPITQTGTDPGGLPIYRYELPVSFPATGGTTYWIGIQASSHSAPPQWGRQEGTSVEGCESMILSAYFGYPDWTLCSVPAHHPWDASVELEINTTTIEACCLAHGICEMLLPGDCSTQGGASQGPGTTCAPTNPCPQPTGACCASNGTCTIETVVDCYLAGDTYMGDGTTCEPNPCSSLEACCAFGVCQMLTTETCTQEGGTPQGPGSTCNPNPCGSTEACCLAGGICVDLDPTLCTETGGTPQGPGSTCNPNPCAQTPEACCFADGHCESLTPTACGSQGGTPFGPGTVCDPNPCPQPEQEACCAADGSCTMALPDACVSGGGNPGGTSSTCEPNICPLVIRTRATTWGGIKALYR